MILRFNLWATASVQAAFKWARARVFGCLSIGKRGRAANMQDGNLLLPLWIISNRSLTTGIYI